MRTKNFKRPLLTYLIIRQYQEGERSREDILNNASRVAPMTAQGFKTSRGRLKNAGYIDENGDLTSKGYELALEALGDLK